MKQIYFQPIFRQNTPRYDLGEVIKTYDYLQQRHDAAVSQENAIQQQFAELDLNSAEDEWKAAKLNQLQSMINEASINGFKGYAYNDIITQGTKLLTGADVRGRLKAQQQYKEYMNNLDKRNDLSEDKKNYFREVNTYHYEDKKDNAGNIIGGTDWQPIDREVSEIPITQLMQQALSIAAKESGGYIQTRWLDANGNLTTDPTKSITGEYFDSTSNSWQRLSKEKLSAALTTVIENTPGAKASLEQDYKIARWKDKKYGYNADVRDSEGGLLNPQEYLQKRIDPFYKAATFYNQNSSVSYGQAIKAQLELQRKVAAQEIAVNPNQEYKDLIQGKTNARYVDNTAPIEAQQAINVAKQNLVTILSNGQDVNFDINKMTNAEIRKRINDLTSPKEKYDALVSLDKLEENQEYLKSIEDKANPTDLQGYLFKSAIDSMSELPDNEITQTYNKYVDALYGDNGISIRNYFNNNDEYISFIDLIGGEKKAKELGIVLGTSSNGYKYAELPKEFKRSLYSFSKAAKQARNNNSNLWLEINRGLTNAFKNAVTFNKNINFTRITNNNEEVEPDINRNLLYAKNIGDVNYGVYGNGGIVANGLVSYVDSFNTNYNNVIKSTKVSIPTQLISATTPAQAEALMNIKSGIGNVSDNRAIIEIENEQVHNLLANINLNEHHTQYVSEDLQQFTGDLKTEDKLKYSNILNNSKPNEYKTVIDIDHNGKVNLIVTIPNKDKPEEPPVRLSIGDIDDSNIAAWENNTNIQAVASVNKAMSFKQPLYVGNSTSFAGIDKLKINPDLTLVNQTTGQNIGMISQEQAVILRQRYIEWNNAVNAVKSGYSISQERLKNMALNTAKEYALVLYNTQDNNVIQQLAKQLIINAYN